MILRNIVAAFLLAWPGLASALVTGLNVNQFQGGSFDGPGQAFTQELGLDSIRVSYNHGDHDFAVNWAAQRNIGVIFFLGYAVGCDPKTPAGRQCYANRSASLVQKYGNKVQYYEVWNEWNGGLGLGGGWPACFPACKDAVMYTDLLCRTYKAIKAVRPSAIVAGAVTAGTHADFIRRMLDAGAGSCMDMVSIHPYPYHPASDFSVASTSPPSVGSDAFIKAVTATHNLVKQKTGKAMQVLVTEEGKYGADQPQADYLTQVFAKGRKLPYLEGIWWFGLEDSPGTSVGTTGIVRSNNTKKPSFFAMKAAAAGAPVTPAPPPLPPPPPVVVEISPDGTTIPPAAFIGDEQKRAWTLSGGRIFIGGAPIAGSSVNLLLKHAGVIYQRNTAANWWKWSNESWVAAADPRAPLPPPPPPIVTQPPVVTPPPEPPPETKMLCEHGAQVEHKESGVIVTCQ